MTREQKTMAWIIGAAVVIIAAVLAARILDAWRHVSAKPVSLIGAVLVQDKDPKGQSPIANAKITATGGLSNATAESDSSGLFHLTLRPGVVPGQPVTLTFEHPEHKPRTLTEIPRDQLYIVRMEPIRSEPVSAPNDSETPAKAAQIKDVRVRYSVKEQTTLNVGSMTKQFEVVNTGNVPCGGHPPCSPDGKWKAAISEFSIDAGKGHEFRNARVSCIAGPCPFTRIQSEGLSRPARTVRISVLNWSDTVAFLVEAEVTRTMVTDMVRRLYPFVTGQAMSFALPAAAEGPSIEADLNGEEIVFPLGPRLVLSWATCHIETAPGHNRIYRCELKPGFQFTNAS
jgi:hypothetical protein